MLYRALLITITLAIATLASVQPAGANEADRTAETAPAQLHLPESWMLQFAGVRPIPQLRPPRAKRPVALPVLYVTLGVLQGLDVYTTSKNLQAGAVELNPILQPVAGNWAATALLKAASTATTIYVAEKLWKKNRTAAVVAMVTSNVLMSSVVARNVRNLQYR